MNKKGSVPTLAVVLVGVFVFGLVILAYVNAMIFSTPIYDDGNGLIKPEIEVIGGGNGSDLTSTISIYTNSHLVVHSVTAYAPWNEFTCDQTPAITNVGINVYTCRGVKRPQVAVKICIDIGTEHRTTYCRVP